MPAPKYEKPFDQSIALDGEEWKPIKGFEDRYMISNRGRVWSYHKNALMSASVGSAGYPHLSLREGGKKRYVDVHRLVAEYFIPNPLGLRYINHKDENKQNNNVENLEWCTQQYNSTYNNVHLRPERLAKLRAVNLGRVPSEETRRKISEAHKGKPMSEKARRRMSEVRIGKKLSDEHRKHIAESHLGHKASTETREKMSRSYYNISFEKRSELGRIAALKRWHPELFE